jgi:hypothetical protein
MEQGPALDPNRRRILILNEDDHAFILMQALLENEDEYRNCYHNRGAGQGWPESWITPSDADRIATAVSG